MKKNKIKIILLLVAVIIFLQISSGVFTNEAFAGNVAYADTALEGTEQESDTILGITTDREDYEVGDTATLYIKTSSDVTELDLWSVHGDPVAVADEYDAVIQSDGTKVFTTSFKIQRSTFFYIMISAVSRENGTYTVLSTSNFELKSKSPKARVSVSKAGSGLSETHDTITVWVDHIVRSVIIYDMDGNEIERTNTYRSMSRYNYMFEFPRSTESKDYKAVIESMAFPEAETVYFTIEAGIVSDVVEQDPAAILEISTDKEDYAVGDTATVSIKTSSEITEIELKNNMSESIAKASESDAVIQSDGTKIFTMSFTIQKSTYFHIEITIKSQTFDNGISTVFTSRSRFELKANSTTSRVGVSKGGPSDTHDKIEIWVDHTVRSIAIYDMDGNELERTDKYRAVLDMFCYTFEFPKNAQAMDYKAVIYSGPSASVVETLYFSTEADIDSEIAEPILEITTDKEGYTVGDIATVFIKTRSDITRVHIYNNNGGSVATGYENDAVIQSDGTKVFTLSFNARSAYFNIDVSVQKNGTEINYPKVSNFEIKVTVPTTSRVDVIQAGSESSDTHDKVEVWVDHVVRSVIVYDMDDNEIGRTSEYRAVADMFCYTFEFPKNTQTQDYKAVISTPVFGGTHLENLYFSIEGNPDNDPDILDQDDPDLQTDPFIRNAHRRNKFHGKNKFHGRNLFCFKR